MLESLRNSMRLPGLRNRLLFTLLMLAVLRLGSHIPVPGVKLDVVQRLLGQGGLLGLVDLFSGGAFKNLAIFAMSVTPYINSSIIMQLLTIVIPRLEEMQKEGEEGRKKIQQYTRYGTVVLGLVQAFGTGFYLMRSGAFINDGSVWTLIVIMISLTAGTAFLMWLGEMITEKGIGNGISLIIFAGIVARVPSTIQSLFEMLRAGVISIFSVALIGILAVVVVACVILITEGVRKIPVEYAKRVVGKRVYGGQRTHLPMKINQAGVIPIIFAQSLIGLPQTIASWMPNTSWFYQFVNNYLSWSNWWFWVLDALFIIFFTYFYTAVTFNPTEIADNMKKNGGFVPGYRPGKPTADYLARISERLTLVGSLFLAALTILPMALITLTQIQQAYIGGTALLIVVGVGLDTMKQIEAQLVMRHYQGFMRS
ncbi:MAG TPA: preprotein translocase subunit SecY [Symbiobacteriaceae bacterium]|nr:preprotein translocase subunit SecY [Symbiobacteriaceae bacterium]